MSVHDSQHLTVEVDGVTFTVQTSPSPSGLRGQVWYGERRIAGLRLFHDDSAERLLEQVRRHRAVLRAAAELSATPAQEVVR